MDKYVYPNTNVLINKFNIKNAEELEKKERNITVLKALLLNTKEIKHTFDLNHLKEIHKFLFEDIYNWAGKAREVDISKGTTLFCKAINIESFSEEIFLKLKKENYLKDLDKDKTVEKLAELFLDLNALHPFREGNGRTQREFIRELAEDRGLLLDLTKIEPGKMIELSIKDDPLELKKVFLEIMKEKEKKFEFIDDKSNNLWKNELEKNKSNGLER